MFRLLKKAIAMCLIGIGIGVLLVVMLPFTGWLFLVGIGLIAAGIVCFTSRWKGVDFNMTVVVKKVPRFLRGFVKLIFRIKD